MFRAPVTPQDVDGLCHRGRVLVEGGAVGDDLVCDVQALTCPDAVSLEALARLRLTVRRLGRRLVLLHAATELVELLDLVGMTELIRPAPDQPSCVAGSPNSGNRVAVSRKNVNSTIRPSDTSST
ncbi:MAG: STAS domain-containing protein [Spirochaetaceae bacterium]|nr:STAS domain-containing protein [Spirochaetaceae bacterium]